jgi:hypothetical protein
MAVITTLKCLLLFAFVFTTNAQPEFLKELGKKKQARQVNAFECERVVHHINGASYCQ